MSLNNDDSEYGATGPFRAFPFTDHHPTGRQPTPIHRFRRHKGGDAVRITVQATDHRDPDRQEGALAAFLDQQPQLRGRVHLIGDGQQTGGISQSVAMIIIDLGPTVLGTFASLVIAWLRHRTGNAHVTITRADGTKLDLQAQRVKNLSGPELTALATELGKALNAPPPAISPAQHQDQAPNPDPRSISDSPTP
jgi:hypothetical protein